MRPSSIKMLSASSMMAQGQVLSRTVAHLAAAPLTAAVAPDIEAQPVRDAGDLRSVRREPVVAGVINEYHHAALPQLRPHNSIFERHCHGPEARRGRWPYRAGRRGLPGGASSLARQGVTDSPRSLEIFADHLSETAQVTGTERLTGRARRGGRGGSAFPGAHWGSPS